MICYDEENYDFTFYFLTTDFQKLIPKNDVNKLLK